MFLVSISASLSLQPNSTRNSENHEELSEQSRNLHGLLGDDEANDLLSLNRPHLHLLFPEIRLPFLQRFRPRIPSNPSPIRNFPSQENSRPRGGEDDTLSHGLRHRRFVEALESAEELHQAMVEAEPDAGSGLDGQVRENRERRREISAAIEGLREHRTVQVQEP